MLTIPIEKTSGKSRKTGGKSLEDKIKSEILQYLYEQKICILKAKEEKIDLTSDEKAGIEKQINSIIEHGFSGKRINADEYYMKEYGATFEQYEEYMRNDMLSQKYRGFVFDSVKPSEAEILQIFEQDKDRYDKFSVRHILFLTQDLTAGKPLSEDLKQLAKKKADDMLARVKSEEDMKALAIANSEDTGVSQNGGEYIFNRYGMYEKDGRFTESSISSPLDQNFLNWSLNAKVGDVDIVKTQFGYHVIKLESRVPSVFNDVKNKISNEIANQRLENEIENWKKDSKYEIKINDEIYNRINMIE